MLVQQCIGCSEHGLISHILQCQILGVLEHLVTCLNVIQIKMCYYVKKGFIFTWITLRQITVVKYPLYRIECIINELLFINMGITKD